MSLKPDSRFNFINVALWENEEGYWKAFEKSAAPNEGEVTTDGCGNDPGSF